MKNFTPHYVRVEKAVLEDGNITVPTDWVKDFRKGSSLKLNQQVDIVISFKGERKEYIAKLRYDSRKENKSYYSLRFGDNLLMVRLRKEFIYSYMVLQGLIQRRLEAKSKGEAKKLSAKLKGGPQEVLEWTPLASNRICFSSFVKIEDNELIPLFRRLVERDVFGWLFDRKGESIISHSSPWYSRSEFKEHSKVSNVIYYLARYQGNKPKLLYIGKTNKSIGERITIGERHMNMPANWDHFRYDQIKPGYSKFLEQIEGHTIKAAAHFFNNIIKCQPFKGGSYELVNRRPNKG